MPAPPFQTLSTPPKSPSQILPEDDDALLATPLEEDDPTPPAVAPVKTIPSARKEKLRRVSNSLVISLSSGGIIVMIDDARSGYIYYIYPMPMEVDCRTGVWASRSYFRETSVFVKKKTKKTVR